MNQITNKLIPILADYAPDHGARLGQTVGQPALALARAIWELVLPRVQAQAAFIAEGYPQNPAGYAAPMTDALNTMLSNDPALVQQLQTLLAEFEEARQAHQAAAQPDRQATISGSGVITQGSTQTAGQGGVVGSSAGGHIITGSGNQVADTGGGDFVVDSTGVATGPGAQATVNQGLSEAALAELVATITQAIENKPDLNPQEKGDLKQDVQGIAQVASQADPEAVDESFLARRLRNIERMAPDIIDVILATLANPAVGLGVVGAKIKAKAEEIKAARGLN